jgi:hypothetical protein
MKREEIYFRVKRTLIIILVLMIIFNFISIISLNFKLQDNIGAVDILMEYIGK